MARALRVPLASHLEPHDGRATAGADRREEWREPRLPGERRGEGEEGVRGWEGGAALCGE